MNSRQGNIVVEYRGKRIEIPYSCFYMGQSPVAHLSDKGKYVHIFMFQQGEWRPLSPEEYPSEFLKLVDQALKEEFPDL